MYYIDVLMKEHENIMKLTDHMLCAARDVMKGDVNPGDIREITDVIKNYADEYHHKKEEDILFKAMLEHLGDVAEKLIRNGMLVEHDLARYERMMIDESIAKYEKTKSDDARLELIGHLMSYRSLLERHADKENKVLYPFAQKNLPMDVQEELNDMTRAYEEKNERIREKYIDIIEKFKK